MCVPIVGNPHIMDGWGCCRCRVYNGLHRDQCKNCGVPHCDIEVEGDTLKAREEEK